METFVHEGNEFDCNPDLVMLLHDSGISKLHIPRFLRRLEKHGITNTRQLIAANFSEIKDRTNESVAWKIFKQAQLVKRQGNVLSTLEEHKDRSNVDYLTTGSMSIDSSLSTPYQSLGLRSNSIVELIGKSGTGKSMLALTIAMMCMRDKNEAGWGRDVIYLDSTGTLDSDYIELLGRFWEVDDVATKFRLDTVDTIHELEIVLEHIGELLDNGLDVGLIVIDNLYDLISSVLPTEGKNIGNRSERNYILDRIFSKLRQLIQYYNILVIYTNQVERNVQYTNRAEPFRPRGEITMRYLSDITISCEQPTRRESKNWFDHKKSTAMGISALRTRIVRSRWHGSFTGFGLVTMFGIIDIGLHKEVEQMIKKVGDGRWVTSKGEAISVDTIPIDEILYRRRLKIYGKWETR